MKIVAKCPSNRGSENALLSSGGIALAAAILLLVHACSGPDSSGRAAGSSVYGYRVVHVYPHDPGAFTQGLIYRDGFLFESTGRNGQSSLRKVRLETGEVIRHYKLDPQYFAEGLTAWGDTLIQLTWRSNLGFLYDEAAFEVLGTFVYSGEGWGLTHDETRLIMSDGSAVLSFLDPATFQETGHLTVKDSNRPVDNLNELEFVRGEIYANVWQTDMIARISPQTGEVTDWIDLRGLRLAASAAGSDAVLNGIAYDAEGDRLFVTGKLWPKLFEIELERRQ